MPGTLWAIAHMAECNVPGLEEAAALVRPFLDAPEPAVRGQAARCAGVLTDADAVPALRRLTGDDGSLLVYDGWLLAPASVGSLAQAALLSIQRRRQPPLSA